MLFAVLKRNTMTRQLHFAPFALFGVLLLLSPLPFASCARVGNEVDDMGQKISQVWPECRIVRDDNFGSILGFIIIPGSDYIVELSQRSGPRSANSTTHSSFSSLLIALPNKSCLTVGTRTEVYSTENRVFYSEFDGWFATSNYTNAMGKATVTVLSITEQSVTIHIKCSIPCIWYNPLHPMNGETVIFGKTIEVTAPFPIVDKQALKRPQSPIVSFCEAGPCLGTNRDEYLTKDGKSE